MIEGERYERRNSLSKKSAKSTKRQSSLRPSKNIMGKRKREKDDNEGEEEEEDEDNDEEEHNQESDEHHGKVEEEDDVDVEDDEVSDDNSDEVPGSKRKIFTSKKKNNQVTEPKRKVGKKGAQQENKLAKPSSVVVSKSRGTAIKDETSKSKSKSISKIERLEEARQAFKWWEAPELEEGVNWEYLEHSAVKFAPAYEQHHVPMIYAGEEVPLNSEQEELASFYAAIPEDGPQLGNPTTKKVFQENFFYDFQDSFLPGHKIKSFAKCDFSAIKKHLDLGKSLKKAATKDEKDARKGEKDEVLLKFGYALIDGRLEKVWTGLLQELVVN